MAMYYKLFYALAMISAVFIACNPSEYKDDKKNNKEEIELGSMNAQFINNYNNDSLKKSLLDNALNKGDTNSYKSIAKDYSLGGGEKEFLFYALSMASKYDYSQAYFDAYLYFNHLKNNKVLKLVEDYYLIKAFKKGDRSAVIDVRVKYGENIDSARLERYFEKIEKALYKNDIKY